MDKKGKEQWEEMQHQQRSMQDQLSSFARKSDKMRGGLAVSAMGDVDKARLRVVKVFLSGDLPKAVEALRGCLADLAVFDPGYLSTLSGQQPYGESLTGEQRFFVNYLYSEMAKGDFNLLTFLGLIYAQRHIKTNPFVRKEELDGRKDRKK